VARETFEAELRPSGRGGGGHLVEMPVDVARDVDVPDELAEALRRDPAAGTAFASLSYTRRREHASAVADAKRPETRARRVERIVQELLQGVPTTEP
jgi:uncharacterized protein YdeI (YjbR/CyaY-like superfamily)